MQRYAGKASVHLHIRQLLRKLLHHQARTHFAQILGYEASKYRLHISEKEVYGVEEKFDEQNFLVFSEKRGKIPYDNPKN